MLFLNVILVIKSCFFTLTVDGMTYFSWRSVETWTTPTCYMEADDLLWRRKGFLPPSDLSTSLYLSSGPSRRQRSASSPPCCLCCLAACCLWDFQLPSSNTLRDGLHLNPSTLLSSRWPPLGLETLWQVRAQRLWLNTDPNTFLTFYLWITPVDLCSCSNL